MPVQSIVVKIIGGDGKRAHIEKTLLIKNIILIEEQKKYHLVILFITIWVMKRAGTHHNSLDDAEFQANYLLELVEVNKLNFLL